MHKPFCRDYVHTSAVVGINLLQTSVDTECAVQKASVDVNISYY
jgi:hypothetical protein